MNALTLNDVLPVKFFHAHINEVLKEAIQNDRQFPLYPSGPMWKIEQFTDKGKATLTLEVSIDQLPDYLNELAQMLKNRAFINEHKPAFQLLSKREKEVLKFITHNYRNKQIADCLFIAEHTVKTHRKNIIQKLKCKSAFELMMYKVFFNTL